MFNLRNYLDLSRTHFSVPQTIIDDLSLDINFLLNDTCNVCNIRRIDSLLCNSIEQKMQVIYINNSFYVLIDFGLLHAMHQLRCLPLCLDDFGEQQRAVMKPLRSIYFNNLFFEQLHNSFYLSNNQSQAHLAQHMIKECVIYTPQEALSNSGNLLVYGRALRADLLFCYYHEIGHCLMRLGRINLQRTIGEIIAYLTGDAMINVYQSSAKEITDRLSSIGASDRQIEISTMPISELIDILDKDAHLQEELVCDLYAIRCIFEALPLHNERTRHQRFLSDVIDTVSIFSAYLSLRATCARWARIYCGEGIEEIYRYLIEIHVRAELNAIMIANEFQNHTPFPVDVVALEEHKKRIVNRQLNFQAATQTFLRDRSPLEMLSVN